MTSRHSFWTFLAGALFALLPLHLSAQGPRIQFQTNTYDFGRVSQGELVHATFVFTNTGNATLEITDVRPGCGCTTAGAWDRLVEPGKTGVIPLQFNSTGYSGPVHKTPTVICNDTTQPNITLQIIGEIWRPVEVTPTFVAFNTSDPGASNQVQVVQITNNMPQPLLLSDAQSSNPAFKPVIKEVKPGKAFELHLQLVPPFASNGVQGVISVKTSSSNMPVLSVTAMVIVQPALTLIPNTITLQPGPLPFTVTTSIRLQNNQAASLALTNAGINLTNVAVNVREENPGRLFTITLAFPAGFQIPAGTRGEFSVRTSAAQMPVIKVPIVQLPKPPPQPVPPALPALTPPPPEVVLPGPPSPGK